MIEVILKDNEFQYDIKTLFLAFFPQEECVVTEDDTFIEREGFTLLCYIDKKLFIDEFVPHPYSKNQIKTIVYQHCVNATHKSLPWGILTGIRPTKIALRQLMQGKSSEQIYANLLEEYLLHEDKAERCLSVANREFNLMQGVNHRDFYNIYIGIPFCPTRCTYCSFAAYPIKQYKKKVDEYLDALDREIAYVGNHYKQSGKKLHTVYIGGGTPTSLNEEQLGKLLRSIYRHLPMEECREFTVEAGRPDSINIEKLKVMREFHVNRISINPQTMNQKTLDLMGRNHTVESVKDVFKKAREMGFDHINMDLIAGLTGETMDEFRHTLDEVFALNPDSVTLHTLVIKRASALRNERMNEESLLEENPYVDNMHQLCAEYAHRLGYAPYYMYRQKNKAGVTKSTNQENIAYAKPGKECRYNVLIMEELETIVALGAGGSSKYVMNEKDRVERVENVKSVEEYISRIDEMIERKERMK